LAEVRQRLAVDWLETIDRSVGEIAYALGYTDSSNFPRVFRRQAGISPQAWRDKLEKGPNL